jgi:hypothetical protein
VLSYACSYTGDTAPKSLFYNARRGRYPGHCSALEKC